MPSLLAIASCFVVLATELSGCRSRPADDRPLVIGIESMPTNLDPRFATDAASSRIDELVFRSLTQLDERPQYVPDIAIDWQYEDPTTVRFRLREDATFADGSRVTADDVRATYESILDPATASPKREEVAIVRDIETPDDHTVRFRLHEPRASFLGITTIGVLPRATIRSRSGELVGAGVFRIVSLHPGHEIRLSRRRRDGGVPEIRVRVIPDDTVRALELANGDLDLVENAIEPDNLRWLAEHSAACVERTPGTTFQYLGINFADPRLRDRRVRQAIALAIDRDALIDGLLNGTARAASGLLPPEHWAHEPDVRGYGHDPAAARRLLDEAGAADPDGDGPLVRFRLSYKTSTLDSRRRIGEALQAMLAEVGIGLDVRSYEWATFYDDIRRGNFQLYSLAWVGASDPDFYFAILNSAMAPPRGNNRGGYADAEIDRLTLLGRRTLDPAARRPIYGEIQRHTAEDLPFIPLWWTDNVVVRSPRLCGFSPRPDGSLQSLNTAWLAPAAAEARGAAGPCGCGNR